MPHPLGSICPRQTIRGVMADTQALWDGEREWGSIIPLLAGDVITVSEGECSYQSSTDARR